MNDLFVTGLVSLVVMAGALFGMFLNRVLPPEHIGEDARSIVNVEEVPAKTRERGGVAVRDTVQHRRANTGERPRCRLHGLASVLVISTTHTLTPGRCLRR